MSDVEWWLARHEATAARMAASCVEDRIAARTFELGHEHPYVCWYCGGPGARRVSELRLTREHQPSQCHGYLVRMVWACCDCNRDKGMWTGALLGAADRARSIQRLRGRRRELASKDAARQVGS